MNKIRIGSKVIAEGESVFIIAEAGVNHNGDINRAIELVRQAKKCGADCVKFQTFQAKRLVLSNSPKAAYQLKSTDPDESQLEMLQNLELSEAEHKILIETCREKDILFLSTPYDFEDVDLLDSLDVKAFKIASGQAVEPEFLKHVARKGRPIILSTGMCTLAEVDQAVRVIRGEGNNQVVVLQCTTNYPSVLDDANLRAMLTMRDAFGILAGYSDHTESMTAFVVAAGLGACVLERHFTLDKTLPGPDHSSSSSPEEFSRLVRLVREAERCLGSSRKEPTDNELENAQAMRRSIVAKVFIPAGTELSMANLTVKRPAIGLKPGFFSELIGARALVDIPADTMVKWGMFK